MQSMRSATSEDQNLLGSKDNTDKKKGILTGVKHLKRTSPFKNDPYFVEKDGISTPAKIDLDMDYS